MDPAEDGLPIPQRYWAILTLMVGVALSCLDTALVNVALPRIAKDLNSSPADSIWVVNAYQLAVMISLLPLALLPGSRSNPCTRLVTSCSISAAGIRSPAEVSVRSFVI